MSQAKRRLIREHALWQSSTIFTDQEFDASHFVKTGSINPAKEHIIPYDGNLIQQLVDKGMLR